MVNQALLKILFFNLDNTYFYPCLLSARLLFRIYFAILSLVPYIRVSIQYIRRKVKNKRGKVYYDISFRLV